MGSLPTKSQLLIALFASAAWVMPAAAQTGAKPATDNGEVVQGGDIIVTAGKFEQKLTEVPIAITAVGAEEVFERGANDLRDLQFAIPGLNIVSLTPGAEKVQLRGIDPGSGTGLPVVGIYVDEVGISVDQQQRDPTFPLVDIARVEVLRGPQGTLYGQGSMAGTIRYITTDPSLTDIGGYALANVNTQRFGGTGYKFNGALGIPLVQDKLGIRIGGGYEHYAGWIDYPTTGLKDVNSSERKFVRAKLLFKPSDSTSMSLLYQYLDVTSDSFPASDVNSVQINTRQTAPSPSYDRSHLVNFILTQDMGPVTLTSSTGYQDRTYAVNLDFGYLPFRIITNTKYKQFTQEFRFSSSDQTAPITYVGGLWYRSFDSQSVRTGTLIATGAPFAPLARVGDDPVDSKAYAVFGDVTYAASPMFDLSAGMRYYYDERTSTTVSPVPNSLSAAFRNFSPKVTAKVKWSDNASTYATISRGFRSGGFNSSGTTFAPETVWNYEIGTKAALLNNALFLDVVGYYLDYQNRQSQGIVFISGTPFTETRNGGKASGPGVEVGLSAKLPAGFRASVNFAYTDVKYDITTGDVNKGDPFSYVPKFSGAASLSQHIPLGDSFTGYWRVDYQHASNASSIVRSNIVAGVVVENGNPALENVRTGEQDILNFRLGAEIGKFDVSLDVYNILNEDAVTFYTSPVSASGQAQRVRPRSAGITLRYNFDK